VKSTRLHLVAVDLLYILHEPGGHATVDIRAASPPRLTSAPSPARTVEEVTQGFRDKMAQSAFTLAANLLISHVVYSGRQIPTFRSTCCPHLLAPWRQGYRFFPLTPTYQTIWRHTVEDHNLNIYHHENLTRLLRLFPLVFEEQFSLGSYGKTEKQNKKNITTKKSKFLALRKYTTHKHVHTTWCVCMVSLETQKITHFLE
jgi:hypothetical protein